MGFLDPMSWANALDTSAEDTANKAIDQQTSTANKSLALQESMYNKGQADFKPFLEAGTGALSRLQSLEDSGIGTDPEYQKYLADMKDIAYGKPGDIYNDPVYKFQQEEASRDLSRKLRSMGRENSTYGMNALGRQSNQLAVDQYGRITGDRFSRLSGLAGTRYSTLMDKYNRLRDLAGSGQAAAGMTANAGANYGQSASNTLSSLGANQASATLAGGLMKAGQNQNSFNNMSSLANLGLKAYDKWGGNSTGSGKGLYGDTGFNYGGLSESDALTYQTAGDDFGGVLANY